jgi:hypothetical protein
MEKIEYRVRPVLRYIVTRYHEEDAAVGSECKGEFDSYRVAHEVGYALCKEEHRRLEWLPGDDRIQYPRELDVYAIERAVSDIAYPQIPFPAKIEADNNHHA